MDLTNVLFTTIGLLIGLGGMAVWVKKSQDDQAIKLQAAEKDIEQLHNEDDHLSERVNQAISLHQEAVRLVTKVVDQNNLLIQKMIARNGD